MLFALRGTKRTLTKYTYKTVHIVVEADLAIGGNYRVHTHNQQILQKRILRHVVCMTF